MTTRNKDLKIILRGKDLTSSIFGAKTARVLAANDDLLYGSSKTIAYVHSGFANVCLPYKQQPLSVRTFEAVNGDTQLHITAGVAYNNNNGCWEDMPLPYGIWARQALIHFSSEAVKNQSPVIKAERSLTGFLKLVLGRVPNGNDVHAFKRQMVALGTSTVRIARQKKQSQSQIVSDFDLMWLQKDNHRVLWPSEFVLSSEYWTSLQQHAVPLDMLAIRAISHSALAMDIYMWLAQRLHRVREPYTLYWSLLWQQFGSGYKRLRDFRVKFEIALWQVKKVYPSALVNIAFSEGGRSTGITLRRSPPPIPKNYQ